MDDRHDTGVLPQDMRAAVYHGPGDVRIEQVTRPDPGPEELLIRVTVAGICGTDVHEFAAGPFFIPLEVPHPVTGHRGPMIMGHEFAGRVVAAGAGVDERWLGRSIVSGAGYSCGVCEACRAKRTNLCDEYATVGLHRNGGLAQYCAVPVAACEDVGDRDLPGDVPGLAQPAAIAMHALRRGRVRAPERLTIIGAGGIGAFLAAGASAMGTETTVLDLDAERLEIAAALGAHHIIHVAAEDDLTSVVSALAPRPDVIFEVTGVAGVLASVLALRLLGTRIVVVGLQDGALPVTFRQLTLLENELIGTNALVRELDLPAAVDLLQQVGDGWARVAPTVLGLDQLVEQGLAGRHTGGPPPIKTLIDPWAEQPRSVVAS